MPIIKVEDGDAFEDKAVAEGQYDLRVTKAENVKSKKGKDMLHLMVKVDGEEEAAPINLYILHPVEEEEQSYRFRMRDMMRLAALFGLAEFDYTDEDQIADLVGKDFSCFLNLETDDETGDERNTLRLPKVRGKK